MPGSPAIEHDAPLARDDFLPRVDERVALGRAADERERVGLLDHRRQRHRPRLRLTLVVTGAHTTSHAVIGSASPLASISPTSRELVLGA